MQPEDEASLEAGVFAGEGMSREQARKLATAAVQWPQADLVFAGMQPKDGAELAAGVLAGEGMLRGQTRELGPEAALNGVHVVEKNGAFPCLVLLNLRTHA